MIERADREPYSYAAVFGGEQPICAFSEEVPIPQSVTPTNTPARRLLAMLDHKFAPPDRDGFHRNTLHRQVVNYLLQLDPITQDQSSACANCVRKAS